MKQILNKIFGYVKSIDTLKTKTPLKERREPTPPFYTFLDVEADDLSAYADGLGNIYHRKIDGMIVRNVLSSTDVAKIVQNIEQLEDAKKRFVPPGYVYPITFAECRE